MTFFDKNEIQELFKENFEIINLKEIDNDGETGTGDMKHWNIYIVTAKKIK